MSFLLKIVQGPQSGAEIALIEGVNLSVGRADTCDIVLNDASVADKAFELEVTGERVVAILPGGKDIKFEPFHVVTIGTTSLAVGPGEEAWKDLVWPKVEKPVFEKDSADADAPAMQSAPDKARRRKGVGCLFFGLIILLLLGLAAAWAIWKHPEKSKEGLDKFSSWIKSSYEAGKNRISDDPPAILPKETLDDVAKAYHFEVMKNDGKISAKGDFKTRAQRLEATAKAYAAHPGLEIDFSDAETLKSAADELLNLVADGRIHATKVEGRKVFLEGSTASHASLRRILEALSADLPKITGADCSRVTTGVARSEEAQDAADDEKDAAPRYRVPRMKAERSTVKSSRSAHPEMPVAGILTIPYPCLVLSDGSRAMEGARFGEYVVEKIERDRVTVRGSEGLFIWRP